MQAVVSENFQSQFNVLLFVNKHRHCVEELSSEEIKNANENWKKQTYREEY